jgi:hypothetical protein
VPADLAVNRRWVSNADGYVYTVGYFTAEQLNSPAWEAARLARRSTVRFCPDEEVVHRDVRWYEPIAPGEPRCAAVVYSIACTRRRPEWGSSLEYERRQALLEDMEYPITAGCGDKDGANQPDFRTPRGSNVVLSSTTDLCRDMLPDLAFGSFRLREANFVQERTIVSNLYIRRERPYTGGGAGFLAQAAEAGQRLHFVVTSHDLPHDRHNIFVDQVFTENGEGYCVTLTARQGDALWRRTVKRDSFPTLDHAMSDQGHSRNPNTYWDAYTDTHLLQHQLALHLGLDLPRGHPTDAVIGNSQPSPSEAEPGRGHDGG